MDNWNPQVEHIEGKLCEKGLLKESYDSGKDELVRTFTPVGRTIAKNLLRDPEWRRAYLIMAKAFLSKLPLEERKIQWKKIVNQLRSLKARNLKEKENNHQENLDVNFAKEL